MRDDKKYCGIDWHDEFFLGPKKLVLRIIWLVVLTTILVAPPLLLSIDRMREVLDN